MNLTQIHLIARQAESSALEARESAESASTGSPLEPDQLAKTIAQHNIKSADHDAIGQSILESASADKSLANSPAVHAAFSAHVAAASAHAAAASAHQASQPRDPQSPPGVSEAGDHHVSAHQHNTDAQKHMDTTLLLHTTLPNAAPPQKPTLIAAANANKHAADANKIAGAKHTEVVQKPKKPPEPTPKPTEPTPKPTEPTPKPTEPTPKPTEPTPKPTEPTPKPTEPTPKPTEPTPKPTEPTPEPPKPSPIPPSLVDLVNDEIRREAFAIFTERGGQPTGQVEQLGDWFQAKSNVLAKLVAELDKNAGLAAKDS